jgi:hypothetical protein
MSQPYGYSPGYGGYSGIAYTLGLDAPMMAAPLSASASIASPQIAPASKPLQFVTSGQQDQDIKAAFNPNYAAPINNAADATLGAPAPDGAPASANTILAKSAFIGVVLIAGLLIATQSLFGRS